MKFTKLRKTYLAIQKPTKQELRKQRLIALFILPSMVAIFTLIILFA